MKKKRKIVYRVQILNHEKKVICYRDFNPVDLDKLLEILNGMSDWETLD